MAEAEFDAVAADYETQHAASIRLSGEDTGYFAEYKAQVVRAIAERTARSPADILDFGSGIGNSVAPLKENFPAAQLHCLDMSAQSIAVSRQRHGDQHRYLAYDGMTLPADLGAFDLIFTACVFHHIPAQQHVDLLSQLRTRLNPGGMFMLFEHNPWNPLTLHAVNTCPFDENAVLIAAPEMRRRVLAAGFAHCTIRYHLFFPHMLAPLRRFERHMTAIPIGAQYSLSAW